MTRSHRDLDLRLRETLSSKLLQERAKGGSTRQSSPCNLGASTGEAARITEGFVLVRPGGDNGKPVPDPDTLREMKLLLLEDGHCFRDQAFSICGLHSTRLREHLDSISLTTAGANIGRGPWRDAARKIAITAETRSAPVLVAHFSDLQPSRTVGGLWRRSSPLDFQLMRIASKVQGRRKHHWHRLKPNDLSLAAALGT
jgi:LysR family hydrogen peroxide-inducible transcriptional activator